MGQSTWGRRYVTHGHSNVPTDGKALTDRWGLCHYFRPLLHTTSDGLASRASTSDDVRDIMPQLCRLQRSVTVLCMPAAGPRNGSLRLSVIGCIGRSRLIPAVRNS